jgi:hypothetical protein
MGDAVKSKLKLVDHRIVPGEKVVEVWDADEFIASVVGADTRGLRVISKHPVRVVEIPGAVNVIEVWFEK